MHEQFACLIPQTAREYGITGGEVHRHVLLDGDAEEAHDIVVLSMLTAFGRGYEPQPCFLVQQGGTSRATYPISP
jgi:hypothetical protein